ncbi:unnamed protein product [Ectocarpus sp. 6 AP-2014]
MLVVGSVLKRAMYFATLPLRVLYFHGPRLWGYGFQEGVEREQSCEQFTSVRSSFWSGSSDAQGECIEMLERKFNGFVVGLFALAVAGACYQYVQFVAARRVLAPAVARLEDVLRYLQQSKEQTNKQQDTGTI